MRKLVIHGHLTDKLHDRPPGPFGWGSDAPPGASDRAVERSQQYRVIIDLAAYDANAEDKEHPVFDASDLDAVFEVRAFDGLGGVGWRAVDGKDQVIATTMIGLAAIKLARGHVQAQRDKTADRDVTVVDLGAFWYQAEGPERG